MDHLLNLSILALLSFGLSFLALSSLWLSLPSLLLGVIWLALAVEEALYLYSLREGLSDEEENSPNS